jgi:sulfate/thiosulfate transport system ATP-binding protein
MLPEAGVTPAGIALDGVSKRFGDVLAVDGVTFDVAPGSLTAILGPSGCGKSTLLRLLAGFEHIDAGHVTLAGRDVTNVPLRERNIGFVFQGYALFPHLSVAQNIAFPLDVRKADRAATRARVAELLDLVQLPGHEGRFPHELSGGQRQRVALARALAARPAILLLDEPFAALDVHVRRDLRASLRRLHDEVHVTTLLVTHDADEAMEIADALVLMQNGRVEQSGTPLDLYERPVSPFALHFLGPANIIASDGNLRYVRPHELRVDSHAFDGSQPARVSRIIDLGSRRRVDLVLPGGDAVSAEVRAPYNGLSAVRDGDTVHFALVHQRSFEAASPERL